STDDGDHLRLTHQIRSSSANGVRDDTINAPRRPKPPPISSDEAFASTPARSFEAAATTAAPRGGKMNMNMNLDGLLWMNAATASACYEVKALAPALANLLYDPVMPDRPLAVVLDWAEVAIAPGSMAAFELSHLRAVLPAMVT